jgi:mutator protein MutT
MNQPFIEVAAALIFRDSKLLIAQRPPGVHLAGLWEFPGGKRESGETFETCLLREIREELDCDIRMGDLVFQTKHDYPGKSIDIRFYQCQLHQGEPKPVECAAVEWISVAQLRDFEFPKADEKLLYLLTSRTDLWS